MPNPHAPRPPFVPELFALPDPEEDERPEPLFVPDPDLALWVKKWFFHEDSPLLIEDHVDVMEASIGFVWTNAENKRQGRLVAGTAQLGKPGRNVQDGWTRAAIEFQRREWFGELPDLLVTLSAPYCARCESHQVLALIDHELSHFEPKLDKDGEPVVDEETGRMTYRMVGHDTEEFDAVIRRFGAWEQGLVTMKRALDSKPTMDMALVERIVGPPLVRDW